MYTLYTIPGSCSTGITILLKKLGIEFNTINRDDVENYSNIVPTNQVPALVDGDKVLTEGLSIAVYLLEKHSTYLSALTAESKSEFIQWLSFNYATLHPAYSKMFTTEWTMEDGEEKSKYLQALADKVSVLWTIVDEKLATSKYVAGEEATIIDYLIAIYSSWNNFFPSQKIALGDNVKHHISHIKTLPEFQEGYAWEKVEFNEAA